MTRSIASLTGAALAAALLAGPAFSQGAPQTISLMKVDPATLATGYRSSKVVGSKVLNDANESIGTVDDLIVTTADIVPFAVLSVGGFLGLGRKHVVVPASALTVEDSKIVLHGGTKDSLMGLPDFIYAK